MVKRRPLVNNAHVSNKHVGTINRSLQSAESTHGTVAAQWFPNVTLGLTRAERYMRQQGWQPHQALGIQRAAHVSVNGTASRNSHAHAPDDSANDGSSNRDAIKHLPELGAISDIPPGVTTIVITVRLVICSHLYFVFLICLYVIDDAIDNLSDIQLVETNFKDSSSHALQVCWLYYFTNVFSKNKLFFHETKLLFILVSFKNIKHAKYQSFYYFFSHVLGCARLIVISLA